MRIVNIPIVLIDLLTAHQLKVLLYAKSHVVKKYNRVTISKLSAAKAMGMSEKTIDAALDKLCEMGILREEHKSRRFKDQNGLFSVQPAQYSIHDIPISQKFERTLTKYAEDNESIRAATQRLKHENNRYTLST